MAVLGVAGILAAIGQSPAAAVVAPIGPDSLMVPLPVSPEIDTTPPQVGTGSSPAATDPAGSPDPAGDSTADPAGATPSEALASHPVAPTGTQVWTTLRLSAQDALNAHTSDLSPGQLLATLGRAGTLTVNLRVDPAVAAPGEAVLDPAWVKCPADSWCGPGQVVAIAGLGAPEGPQQWSDYTGSVWDRNILTAPGRTVAVPARANALHTVIDATLPAGSPGATTWVAQLWPQLSSPDQLPRPGQTLKLRYRLAADASVRTVPVRIPGFPVSVPVVNATTVGTIAGDTLTTDPAGRLAVSLWRPQQLGATAADPVTDLAGEYYGFVLSDGTSRISCSPHRYSDPVGLAMPDDVVWDGPTGENTLALRDSAPMDLAVATASPIGFTLDVAGCLADSAARGIRLGSPLTATLLAADSAAASPATDALDGAASASAGVTYRLEVPAS